MFVTSTPLEPAIVDYYLGMLPGVAPDDARRRLVLLVRETPFNLAHLRNMTAVTEMGGVIFPPLPAFYHRPQSIEAMVDETVERVLQTLRVPGATPQRFSIALST